MAKCLSMPLLTAALLDMQVPQITPSPRSVSGGSCLCSKTLRPKRENSELLRDHEGQESRLRRGYLTDATAPALEGILLVFLVIFFNLLRKESVEDLVDQLGGGGLGGALVLLLGRLPDGLPPFGSPGREIPRC